MPDEGSNPGPPALGVQSLSHWTTTDVPDSSRFLRKECRLASAQAPEGSNEAASGLTPRKLQTAAKVKGGYTSRVALRAEWGSQDPSWSSALPQLPQLRKVSEEKEAEGDAAPAPQGRQQRVDLETRGNGFLTPTPSLTSLNTEDTLLFPACSVAEVCAFSNYSSCWLRASCFLVCFMIFQFIWGNSLRPGVAITYHH